MKIEAELAAEAEANANEEGEEVEAPPEKERPQFNEEEFTKKYDEEFPPIPEPPEVIEDIDADLGPAESVEDAEN